ARGGGPRHAGDRGAPPTRGQRAHGPHGDGKLPDPEVRIAGFRERVAAREAVFRKPSALPASIERGKRRGFLLRPTMSCPPRGRAPCADRDGPEANPPSMLEPREAYSSRSSQVFPRAGVTRPRRGEPSRLEERDISGKSGLQFHSSDSRGGRRTGKRRFLGCISPRLYWR